MGVTRQEFELAKSSARTFWVGLGFVYVQLAVFCSGAGLLSRSWKPELPTPKKYADVIAKCCNVTVASGPAGIVHEDEEQATALSHAVSRSARESSLRPQSEGRTRTPAAKPRSASTNPTRPQASLRPAATSVHRRTKKVLQQDHEQPRAARIWVSGTQKRLRQAASEEFQFDSVETTPAPAAAAPAPRTLSPSRGRSSRRKQAGKESASAPPPQTALADRADAPDAASKKDSAHSSAKVDEQSSDPADYSSCYSDADTRIPTSDMSLCELSLSTSSTDPRRAELLAAFAAVAKQAGAAGRREAVIRREAKGNKMEDADKELPASEHEDREGERIRREKQDQSKRDSEVRQMLVLEILKAKAKPLPPQLSSLPPVMERSSSSGTSSSGENATPPAPAAQGSAGSACVSVSCVQLPFGALTASPEDKETREVLHLEPAIATGVCGSGERYPEQLQLHNRVMYRVEGNQSSFLTPWHVQQCCPYVPRSQAEFSEMQRFLAHLRQKKMLGETATIPEPVAPCFVCCVPVALDAVTRTPSPVETKDQAAQTQITPNDESLHPRVLELFAVNGNCFHRDNWPRTEDVASATTTEQATATTTDQIFTPARQPESADHGAEQHLYWCAVRYPPRDSDFDVAAGAASAATPGAPAALLSPAMEETAEEHQAASTLHRPKAHRADSTFSLISEFLANTDGETSAPSSGSNPEPQVQAGPASSTASSKSRRSSKKRSKFVPPALRLSNSDETDRTAGSTSPSVEVDGQKYYAPAGQDAATASVAGPLRGFEDIVRRPNTFASIKGPLLDADPSSSSHQLPFPPPPQPLSTPSTQAPSTPQSTLAASSVQGTPNCLRPHEPPPGLGSLLGSRSGTPDLFGVMKPHQEETETMHIHICD
ncbi:unnamed protein product [Amoebophrya sp. A120]|nr:unnamed protein product [Amoebophrya sp. A120]|eukprot:GSA120T00009581001.1